MTSRFTYPAALLLFLLIFTFPLHAQIPQSGLVAHWDFEGDASNVQGDPDFDGTLTGNATTSDLTTPITLVFGRTKFRGRVDFKSACFWVALEKDYEACNGGTRVTQVSTIHPKEVTKLVFSVFGRLFTRSSRLAAQKELESLKCLIESERSIPNTDSGL